MHGDSGEGVWDIGYEASKNGVWWWWFWLVFLENPDDPQKPIQLMTLWSTKKEKHFNCNGLDIRFNQKVDRTGARAQFDGAVAGWLFDGKKMRENFILRQTRISLDSGKKSLSAGGAGFSEKNGAFDVDIAGAGARLRVRTGKINRASEPMEHTSAFVKKFTYKISKVNLQSVSGTLELDGRTRKVKGTAYFQKVVVKAPVLPWLWSIVHFADGSFLSYFCPRVGHSLVGKDLERLGRNVLFKSKLEFFCAQDGSYREFRPCRISSRVRNGMPAWSFEAKGGGESLQAELEAYSEASWKIQNGLTGALRHALHYDEYCVNASRLVFRRTGRPDYTLADAGRGVGNAEHSWGFMI